MPCQICVNCNMGVPGYPSSHGKACSRPKYVGDPDADSPMHISTKRGEAIRIARELYQTDEVNVDDDAVISETDEGRSCWVQAWVWVHDDEFNEEIEEDPPADAPLGGGVSDGCGGPR